MSGSGDVIAGAIRKPDSECMVLKTYIFLTVTFYLRKAENRTKKFRTQLSYNFRSNNADTSNIKKVLLLKSENYIGVCTYVRNFKILT